MSERKSWRIETETREGAVSFEVKPYYGVSQYADDTSIAEIELNNTELIGGMFQTPAAYNSWNNAQTMVNNGISPVEARLFIEIQELKIELAAMTAMVTLFTKEQEKYERANALADNGIEL